MKRLKLFALPANSRWSVLRFAGRTKWHQALWLCRCACGRTERPVLQNDLTSGKSLSCGCISIENKLKHGEARKKGYTREYRAWKGAKQRVSNSHRAQAKDYIGRGITMCQRWLNSFQNFRDDMGVCPSGLTLERKDNNGNYEPGNCVWATRKTQSNNTRRNCYLTCNGRTQTKAQWSRELGIDHRTLDRRIEAGWSLDKALTTICKRNRI